MQEAIRQHQARAPSANMERRTMDLPDRRQVRVAVAVERRGAGIGPAEQRTGIRAANARLSGAAVFWL